MSYHPPPAAVCLLSVTTCAMGLSASQPWTGKDFTQWTPAEVERVLTDSPWAQQTMASFGKPLEPEDIPFTPPPGASQNGMAGTRGVSDGHWDGGVARNTGVGEVPSLPVTVRWDSALPIRQALSRSQKTPPVGAQAESDYIVTVIGLVPADTHASSSQAQESSGVQREASDPAQIARAFTSNTLLIPEGKPPRSPEDVKFDPATGAVHLFFARRNPITLRDKEVILLTRFGSVKVQKKFRLKAMTYNGRLEL